MQQRRRIVMSGILVLSLAMECSGKPDAIDGAKGVQLMSGSSAWLSELGKLKSPSGILPTGTSFSATNIIYKDPATFNEFFVFDSNASLILLSANPVYFMRIDSRDFKFKLANELAQINAGKTATAKAQNSITYFKDLGDSQVEIFFTPNELNFTSSGSNKYGIKDQNDTTYVDLWRLYEAAGNASFYTPIFADQKIADDFYLHSQAGKRRLVLTNSNYVSSPQIQNTISTNLNFSAMIGTDLSITDNILGTEDINFQDRYALQRGFGAFFSLPLGNSKASGRNCLSQFDGIVVIVRGDVSPFKRFLAAQGVNMDTTPVTATKNVVAPLSAPFCTYVAPSDIVINEVAPNEAGSLDLLELYVQKSTNLNGLAIYGDTALRKTLPNVNVAAGDYIVFHFNAAGTDETISKTQSVDLGNFPGAWDFWFGPACVPASNCGLSGTDDVVVLKSGTGEILDAVLFADYSNSWSTSVSTTTTTAIFAAGRWKTAADTFTESDAVNNFPGGILAGSSYQRKTDGYIVNVSNADWMTAPFTIGAANGGYALTQTIQAVTGPPAVNGATAIDANHVILALSRPITFASASAFSIAGLSIIDAQFSTTYGTQNLITLTTATQTTGAYLAVITSPSNVLDFYGTTVSSTNPLERATFNGFANLTATTVVISEIQVGGGTGFVDDEFVELYNPTNAPISLNTWCLRTKSNTTTGTNPYHTFGAVSIPAYGYYLVGGGSYSGTGAQAADATRSSAGASISGSAAAILLGNATCATAVDVVAWGGHTVNNYTTTLTGNFINSNPVVPGDYQSIERKNNPNATAVSLGNGGADEFKGNGWDSGINNVDFILRTTPKPQNSASTPETPAL